MSQTVLINDISIVMPVKNGSIYIKKSLRNLVDIADQAEIVIIDDGSVDGTWEYCQEFANSYDNVVVRKNPGSGICAALNYGIQISHGNWIARVDVDDEYQKSRLPKQLEVLNSSNAILVFSDYAFISDHGSDLGSMESGVFNLPTKISLVTSRRTAHPSALFSKQAFLSAGGYLLKDVPAEDLSLWLRLVKFGDFASVPEDLLHYRLSHGSVTVQQREKSIQQRNSLLAQYGIEPDLFLEATRHFTSTIRKYRAINQSSRRITLHIIDLFVFSKIYGIRMPKKVIMLSAWHMILPRNLKTVLELLIEARRRSNFRNLKQN